MNQMPNQNPQPPNMYYQPPFYPIKPPAPPHKAGRKELIFAVCLLFSAMILWNSILFGDFHLGYAIGSLLTIGCSVGYLLWSGHRIDWYSGTLLGFSVVICAGFGWSDDIFVKLVMLLFVITALNLGLCLTAKQNRYSTGGISSLLDAPITLFGLGCGDLGKSARGVIEAFKKGSRAGRVFAAVGIGILISLPLVAVMIVLLIGADAAFEGLLRLIPKIRPAEIILTFAFGGFAAWLMYTRAVALHNTPKSAQKTVNTPGFSPLTINTVLFAVNFVYTVYLFSQLAYLFGGFAGILPRGYTIAEYARRGFFEMMILCGINLSTIWACVALVKKNPKTPGLTRGLCLFIGLVTIFLVATSCAKMIMYIDGFGLTRLRVLTSLITVFLGITTALVCVWLFKQKLPYMRVVMLIALAMGTVTLWADVDMVVARYNVNAYLDGDLSSVDVAYLSNLGSGAVPYIEELIWDSDPEVAWEAYEALNDRRDEWYDDWRGWCYLNARAQEIVDDCPPLSEWESTGTDIFWGTK